MRDEKLILTAKNFYNKGKEDELFVARAIETQCGGKCTPSTRTEDIFEHIDIWWDSPKKGKLGIDVKGRTKHSKYDTSFAPVHWIEIKNVNGRKGWVYSSSAYIAFRCIDDSIIFVKPKKLISFYENNVKNKEIVHVRPNDTCIPYQREGNQDLLFKISDEELKKLAHFTIP